MKEVQDKNPKDEDGLTPFHVAAGNGHTEICRLIFNSVKEKNPKDPFGIHLIMK